MADTDQSEPSAPSSIPEILLALQAVDTQSDQLVHRRAKSPLHDDLGAATTALRTWERRRNDLRTRIDELGRSIEESEERGAALIAHRKRLDQQMKTVIAPREAEALMHEMATLTTQTDELDGVELEALEEQAQLDDELTAHLVGEEPLRNRLQLADDALATDVADIDAELVSLSARRNELRTRVSDGLLATYDRKRAAFGVAVASLVGKQCQGCHLELSAAEIDTVKSEAADSGVTECPDCGRLLIV